MYFLSLAVSSITAMAVAYNFDTFKEYMLSFREPRIQKVLWIHEDEDDEEVVTDITNSIINAHSDEDEITVDPRKFKGTKSRMEVRYIYRGQKYREVDDRPLVYPPFVTRDIPNTFLHLNSATIIGPTGIEEDVTRRIRKYMGPCGDFHGHESSFDIRWAFPGTKYSDSRIRLDYTERYIHHADLGSRHVMSSESDTESVSSNESSDSLSSFESTPQ